MKVLHITNMFSQGGVDSLLLELLPRLNESHQVELLVLNRRHADLVSKLENLNVNVHIGRYSNVYNPLNILVIRKHIRNYDLVHAHLFPTQLYVVIAKLFSGKKLSLVTTEHCTTNNRRKHLIFKLVDRFMYKRYDKVVGVCEAARTNLTRWLGGGKNMEVIANGISLIRFINPEPYTNLELSLPQNAKTITMVARFFDQKDQATAIRSMTNTQPNIHLLLVGSGQTMEKCQKLAQELAVENRVHFLGRRDDVPRIVASSDICLLSTYYEGLPISIIEYFACGKPVLATCVDGVREMIGDDSLLHPLEDDRALAANIERLLGNPEKQKQLSAENLKKSKKYTIENMTEKYKNLYVRCNRN